MTVDQRGGDSSAPNDPCSREATHQVRSLKLCPVHARGFVGFLKNIAKEPTAAAIRINNQPGD
jgi:hypothetical protein